MSTKSVDIQHFIKKLSDKGELFLCLKVQPKSGQQQLVSIYPELRGDHVEEVLKIKVKAPPEDGKANEEVCELLAKHFSVPKRCVSVLLGQTSRQKVVKIILP